MQNRRKFVITLAATVVGMGLVVASVLADELFGVITKADAEAKKVTVVEKDTDKEIEVKITDDTEYVTKKGTGKVDFEKLEKNIERAKDKGAKGVPVKITHEKGVASKIEAQQRRRRPKRPDELLTTRRAGRPAIARRVGGRRRWAGSPPFSPRKTALRRDRGCLTGFRGRTRALTEFAGS